MKRRGTTKALEIAIVLGMVAFAMLAGAGCYHQVLIGKAETQTCIVHIEPIPKREAREPVEMYEFKVVEKEAPEQSKEDLKKQLEEEAYWAELELLAACVEAEAGNQGLLGKRLVADVILNRVDDPDWPNTITGVITQKNQFTTWSNGMIESVSISDESFEACRIELVKRSYPGIYYFTAGDWGNYGTHWKKVGDHYFCTK